MATDAHRKFIAGFYHMISTNINQPLPHYLEILRADMGGILNMDKRCEYLKKYTLPELRELLYSFMLFNDVRKDKQFVQILKLAIEFIEKDLAAQELGKNICEKSEPVTKKDLIVPPTTEKDLTAQELDKNICEKSESDTKKDLVALPTTESNPAINGVSGKYGNRGLSTATPVLEPKIAQLEASFQKLVGERNALIISNQSVREANKSLIAENKSLDREKMLQQDKIIFLQSDIKHLNSEVEKHKKQLDDIKALIKVLLKFGSGETQQLNDIKAFVE